MSRTNTNAINILTSHCEPEALHRMVHRAKGASISFLLGLFRRPALRGTPRNDIFLIAFVLEDLLKGLGFDKKSSSDIILQNSIIIGPEGVEGQKGQEDQL